MNTSLKIKVCGLKNAGNRKELEALPIDIFGFIFYPQSKRMVEIFDEVKLMDLVNTPKQKAGIFVNEDAGKILEMAGNAHLTHIQLHGVETPEFCRIIKSQGYKIIKVIAVDDRIDFNRTYAYEGVTDYYLFDTKAEIPGGTGKKYNWDLLENYKGTTPFFLSGGINPGDAETIRSFSHPLLYGIDLNSGFEEYPGFKNVSALKQFIDELQK